MKAAVNTQYGKARDVVRIKEIARPDMAQDQVLVKVYATSISTGAWRMVEMNAPGVLGFAARLMFGVFAPRKHVPGGAFSGRVVSVGSEVTKFKMGDEVFGFVAEAAHAEFVNIGQDAAIVKKPASLGYDEAAALPFGGLSALVFLRDFSKLLPAQKILVTGATGGVGVFAVQIAKSMGAEVTALASTPKIDLVRSLGADQVIDYTQQDFTSSSERFDVIFDTAGITSFAKARQVLKPKGKFVPLEFGLTEILQSLKADGEGRKVIIGVNGDSAEDLQILAKMTETGDLRAPIDSQFALDQIVDAYDVVASRHKTGAVVVNVDMPETGLLAAD